MAWTPLAIGVLLMLVAVWGLWPLCWVVDRPRTAFENIRIALGGILLVVVAISLAGYHEVMEYADSLESR
jgi:hypothetical protein